MSCIRVLILVGGIDFVLNVKVCGYLIVWLFIYFLLGMVFLVFLREGLVFVF